MGYFSNTLKTAILIALLTALVLFVGDLFGGTTGIIIAFIFVVFFNGIMYWFSDRIVLWMYRAKELPRNHRVSLMLKEIAHSAGIPAPRGYIVESHTPNAFATGRSPKKGAVAVTTGILHLLTDAELKGVLAHEVSHIKNRDTLITTIAGVLAGIISYLASMARWAAIFGGFGGRDDNDAGGIISIIVLSIITPIIAVLIQLAISRAREYLADESAAKMGEAKMLASALRKLEKGNKEHPFGNGEGSPATGSLFIVNPFRGSWLVSMLSTHPPMDKRIARLEKIQK